MTRKITTKNCLQCNIEFETYNKNRKCCCAHCAAIYRNTHRPEGFYKKFSNKISEGNKRFYNSEQGKKLKEYYKQLYLGKSWEEKYGKEKSQSMKLKSSESGKIAQNKSEVRENNSQKQKIIQNRPEQKLFRSQKFSGKGNPMYGKPSPKGSGNGWSGWYKGWYFRSLLELSYMINVIERFKLNWESAEKRKYRIEYTNYKGTNRSHFADFLLNNKYLVEIKPKKLWNTANNKLINEACRKYCKENDLKFKIIEPIKLNTNIIMDLYKNKKVKFLKMYEEKLKKYEL